MSFSSREFKKANNKIGMKFLVHVHAEIDRTVLCSVTRMENWMRRNFLPIVLNLFSKFSACVRTIYRNTSLSHRISENIQ